MKLPECDLVMVRSGFTRVMGADAVLPVPPFVEVTAPVVLVKLPLAVPVVFTVIVQEEFTAIVPVAKVMEPEPAVAVTVPPQVLVKAFGVETTIPAGKVSVKATPVSAAAFATGLVSVKVRVEFAFRMIDTGLK